MSSGLGTSADRLEQHPAIADRYEVRRSYDNGNTVLQLFRLRADLDEVNEAFYDADCMPLERPGVLTMDDNDVVFRALRHQCNTTDEARAAEQTYLHSLPSSDYAPDPFKFTGVSA